jgi:hypothetical protein
MHNGHLSLANQAKLSQLPKHTKAGVVQALLKQTRIVFDP